MAGDPRAAGCAATRPAQLARPNDGKALALRIARFGIRRFPKALPQQCQVGFDALQPLAASPRQQFTDAGKQACARVAGLPVARGQFAFELFAFGHLRQAITLFQQQRRTPCIGLTLQKFTHGIAGVARLIGRCDIAAEVALLQVIARQ